MIPIIGKSISRNWIITIFLICFILLFLVQNLVFIKNDTFPQRSDGHFHRSLLYYDQIFNHIDGELWRISYPPLFFLLPQPFYKIMGLSTDAPRIALTLLAVIFLLAMFGIGYELGGAYSGASVMALAASSPLILDLSRRYLPEFPQTAFTALCFYFLLKSDGYKRRFSSILFGIALAFSFMIKWSSAFFLLLPVLWFLIPNIFHSKSSFLAFLAFLVPASISGLGMMWFYKKIAPGTFLSPMELLRFYFPIILLPAVSGSVIMLLLQRKFRSMENYCKSGVCSIINFSWSAIIFAVLVSPWFFWAGRDISNKYQILMGEPRRLDENLSSLKYVFMGGFNFVIPLMTAGLIFMLIARKDLFRRLVIPANILILAPIMYYLTYSDYRYLLSLVIFFAALGGFWVCETGKYKGFITTVIMTFSTISMLSGSLIPVSLPVYQPVGPLFVASPPRQNPYDISSPIDFLARSTGNNWKKLFVYEKKEPPIDFEYIQFEAFKKGNRIFPLIRYNEQDESYRFVKDFENMAITLTPVEPDRLDARFYEWIKKGNRRIDSFVRGRLPDDSLKTLESWNPGNTVPHELKTSLAKTLDDIINGGPFYSEELFRDVPLHPVTKKRAEESSYGEQQAQLNKMLMNEAFGHSLMSGSEEERWINLNDVEDIMVLHNKNVSIDFIVRTIGKAYPDVKFNENRFSVGAGYCITIFRLNRELPEK